MGRQSIQEMIMTFEGAFILIPREVVMPFTGFLVHSGEKAITISGGVRLGILVKWSLKAASG